MSVGDLSPKNSLVPVVATLHRVALPCLSHLRSEAPFLVHLIITAQPIQKTETIRAATPRQAQAAYQSASQNLTQAADHKPSSLRLSGIEWPLANSRSFRSAHANRPNG